MQETTDARASPTGAAVMDATGAVAETVPAARSSPATIEAFLASVERRAWRIAEIALRDPDEALDAVQDAMLRLVRHYSDKPPAEWPPLFYGILRRRITDLQRRRTVRKRVLVWTGRDRRDGDGEELPAWEAPDPGPDPARVLASRQAHAAMSEAIRALPRRHSRRPSCCGYWKGSPWRIRQKPWAAPKGASRPICRAQWTHCVTGSRTGDDQDQ